MLYSEREIIMTAILEQVLCKKLSIGAAAAKLGVTIRTASAKKIPANWLSTYESWSPKPS